MKFQNGSTKCHTLSQLCRNFPAWFILVAIVLSPQLLIATVVFSPTNYFYFDDYNK